MVMVASDVLNDAYRSIYAFFTILNKYWYFTSARRFQYLGQLRDGLLQNVWRADIYFSNDNHYGYVKGQCDPKMLSALC